MRASSARETNISNAIHSLLTGSGGWGEASFFGSVPAFRASLKKLGVRAALAPLMAHCVAIRFDRLARHDIDDSGAAMLGRRENQNGVRLVQLVTLTVNALRLFARRASYNPKERLHLLPLPVALEKQPPNTRR